LRSLIILFCVFVLAFQISMAQEKNSTADKNKSSKIEREKFDPSRDPEKDLKAAMKEARQTNKNILLDVGGEWCIWCHRMDEFISQNKEISDLLKKNFVVMKVNFSDENKNEKFLKKFPVIKGYPHIFILDKNGKFLHSQNTGDLELGKGYSKEKFLSFLNNWPPKSK